MRSSLFASTMLYLAAVYKPEVTNATWVGLVVLATIFMFMDLIEIYERSLR